MSIEQTFAIFGRFQPFTRAHEQMVNIANSYMRDHTQYGEDPVTIGMSETTGDFRNPLTIEQRQKIIRDSVSSDINIEFVVAKDPWLFLKKISDNKPLFLFCGNDQYVDYVRMKTYNGLPGQFNFFPSFNVVNCGLRDGEIGISAISATKARKAVIENDLLLFSQIMSPNLNEEQLVAAFNQVKSSQLNQIMNEIV